MQNKQISIWSSLLEFLRRLWLIGEENSLENAFYEPLTTGRDECKS